MGNCCGSADADGKPPSRPPTKGPPPKTTTWAPPTPKPSDGGGGAKQETGGGDDPPCTGPGRVLEAPRLREFTLAELRQATRGFKPEMVLGEGGFGRVYKGWVDERTLNPAKSNAGVIVAVKKLNPESVQGLQEWQVIHPSPLDRFCTISSSGCSFHSISVYVLLKHRKSPPLLWFCLMKSRLFFRTLMKFVLQFHKSLSRGTLYKSTLAVSAAGPLP